MKHYKPNGINFRVLFPPFYYLFRRKHISCPAKNIVLVLLSHVQLFATSWAVAHQGPLCMEFPSQEYSSGLLFPSPGNPPDPGIKPVSPELVHGFFTTEPPGEPLKNFSQHIFQVL